MVRGYIGSGHVYGMGYGTVEYSIHVGLPILTPTLSHMHSSHTGENGSMVSAHLSRAGVLTAYVRTPSQLYFIEPSEHHISEPHPFQMIAYRGSDVRHPIDPRAMDFIVPPVENSTSNLTDWNAPYFGV